MTNKRSNKANGSPKAAKKGRESASEATYLLSLSLENVRCFGPKQTLDLSDGEGRPRQWTILLGDNGTGKTTVLQMLASLLEAAVPEPEVPREGEKAKDPEAIRAFINRWHILRSLYVFHITRREDVESKVSVEVARGTPLQQAEAGIAEMGKVDRTFRWEHGGMTQLYTPTPATIKPPLLYAYGAGRRMGPASLSGPEGDDEIASLFTDQAILRNAEEWLIRLDYAASKASDQRDRQKARFEQVQQLLLAILPDVEAIRIPPATGPFPTPRVEFQTPYGWVPLRQLGYGYQTLIAWMVDFVSRMVERYPDSDNPLSEPAVVLVDEIDLHLHPTWQRKLIGHLTEHFPNTQFIVTAHSPLVVQAAEGANLAVLRREGDHVVIDQSVKAVHGWRVDQVLTSDLFGLPSARPPQLDELMRRREAILTKPKLSPADERELAKIEAKIGELPVGETTEQQKILQTIQESIATLRQELDAKP